MDRILEMKAATRADGAACILAIGTASPPNIIYQKDYPDYYFQVTNSDHEVELKDKFKRICEKSGIRKRHFFLTEEILKANPNMLSYGTQSLDARRAMTVDYVPKISAEAALKAINEWGKSKSKITHLIACTTLASSMPGVDYEIAKLLELDPSVQRTAFYLMGCHGGPHILRIAMDIAENNKGARILIVCSEITTANFHGPCKNEMASLVGQALFGDGATAIIVGADPDMSSERQYFQLVHGFQVNIPETVGVTSEIMEMGQTAHLETDLTHFVSKRAQDCLIKALKPLGITDWNSLFWIAHNGAPKALDQIELELGLEKGKLEVTRHVLSEYGHLGLVGVYFMLDEMRKRSSKECMTTTGLGLEWGVMFGYGPGLTIETLVLRSVPLEA